MIEEFGKAKLERRRVFLQRRARAHLMAEGNTRWHLSAAATLLRDAAAVALILDDFGSARSLLQESGDRFLELGLPGGLQLLYIAGSIDKVKGGAEGPVERFAMAFAEHAQPRERSATAPEIEFGFADYSFQPPQLLRAYQALAGRRANDDEQRTLRDTIRQTLNVNATMPVGPTRTTAASYLAAFDLLAKREHIEIEELPGGVEQFLTSLVQRRDELLAAARRDRFHWKALLRPAELVDFDLLALLLVGVRRGQASKLIASVFAGRDATTALPQNLALAMND